VAREGPPELQRARAPPKVELGIEGVQPEEVPVASVAAPRAGAAAADDSEVVSPFHRRAFTFGAPARARVDSPGEPVREGPDGRIPIVDDQGERARPRGRL